MRFTTAQTDMYADHLDWHFRQNHAGKVASKKVTHRRWYYSLTVRTHTPHGARRLAPCGALRCNDTLVVQDWIEFEEIADLEERAKSQFFEKENEEEVQKSQAAAKEKEFQSVRATKDQVGEVSTAHGQSTANLLVGDITGSANKNASFLPAEL